MFDVDGGRGQVAAVWRDWGVVGTAGRQNLTQE